MNSSTTEKSQFGRQFSLAELFEMATLCAVLAALFRSVGAVPIAFLMGMAIALGLRQGVLAIVMFMCACLTSEISANRDTEVQQQLLVILMGSAICAWYLIRRKWSRRPTTVPDASFEIEPTAEIERLDGRRKVSGEPHAQK